MSDNYSRGREWAEDQLRQGVPIEHIEMMLDGLPPLEFDQGALDAIRDSLNSKDGEPMEIERRFLVTGDDWRRDASSRLLTQGYLSVDPTCTIRIRIDGDSAILTLKGKKSEGGGGLEFEYPVPFKHGVMLSGLCQDRVVEKIRYTLPFAGKTWEIDEFLGDNTGLVVAEIELAAEDESFDRPAWLGCEVTSDSAYSNARLAVCPYRKWDRQ